MRIHLKRWWLLPCLTLVAGLSFAPVAPVAAEETDSEETSDIDFWGRLQELSSTDVPTTIVVRKDPDGEFTDYTVDIDEDTAFGTSAANTTSMSDWITGDYLHVIGELNENTDVVTAEVVVNSSISLNMHRGLNGWITEIDEDDSTMTVQWNGEEHTVNVTENTHMVVPPTNPASLSDFEVGDRVRLRLMKGSDTENEARIIVALRRGDHIYLKARTRGFAAELTDIDADGDGTGELTVSLLANAHLRDGDVNNLNGTEVHEVTVEYDENTKFVRRFNGETTVDEFVIGDTLFIVGRVEDEDDDDEDVTVTARLIKDVNIWRMGVFEHAGEVESIDTDDNVIVVTSLRDDDENEVEISYSDETSFKEGGEDATEDDVDVGDIIHVRGTAHWDDGELSITNVEMIGIKPGPVEEDEDEDEGDEEDEDDEDLPDLTVDDIELEDNNTLVITLENEGEADADEDDVSIYIYIDGELEWTYSATTLSDQDFLEADGSSELSPQTLEEDATVEVCIDPNDDVEEEDEDNNCLEEDLEVEE